MPKWNRPLSGRREEKMKAKLKKMSNGELKTLINDMSERGGSGIFFSPATKQKIIDEARKELESR